MISGTLLMAPARACLCVLCGLPAAGKSRLAQELRGHARKLDWMTLLVTYDELIPARDWRETEWKQHRKTVLMCLERFLHQTHTHTLSDQTHTHTLSDQTHTHTLSDQTHTHTLSDQTHTHTLSDQTHTHTLSDQTHTNTLSDQTHTHTLSDQTHTHTLSDQTHTNTLSDQTHTHTLSDQTHTNTLSDQTHTHTLSDQTHTNTLSDQTHTHTLSDQTHTHTLSDQTHTHTLSDQTHTHTLSDQTHTNTLSDQTHTHTLSDQTHTHTLSDQTHTNTLSDQTHTHTLSDQTHTNTLSDQTHTHTLSDQTHTNTLSDQTHTHTLSDQTHTHTLSDQTHTHTLSDQTHTHTLSDQTHTHTLSDQTHTHTLSESDDDVWMRFQQMLQQQSDSHTHTHSRPLVVLLDDNFYYQSMRHQIHQLARKYAVGFCQVFLRCPLQVCVRRNQERAQCVPEEVLLQVCARMEPPDPSRNRWEQQSLALDATDHIAHGDLQRLMELLASALENPLRPIQDESQQKEADRRICASSALHQADRTCRRVVSQAVASAREARASPHELKALVSELNELKTLVLQDLKRDPVSPEQKLLVFEHRTRQTLARHIPDL